MNKDVWLFPQNASKYDQFMETIEFINNNNGINREDNLTEKLMRTHAIVGQYNPYNKAKKMDRSSANHKIDEPRFYGALYDTPNKKIHLSTYGELLLKYKNDKVKQGKVFIAMLYRVQFINPYKKMLNFNIYPFRLIFKLLREGRLNYTLYMDEVSHVLYSVKKVKTIAEYNNIVDEIIKFRTLSSLKKNESEKEDAKQFVVNLVSCGYMFNMLHEFNIVKLDDLNEVIRIKSPVRAKETVRKNRKISLLDQYKNFVDKISMDFTIFDDVLEMEQLFSDWIRNIYDDVPELLLTEIGEKDEEYVEFLQIPLKLEELSQHGDKWDGFEIYLEKAFGLFDDIRAERISGAGNTDVLCYYTEKKYNFCADAKATHKKLGQINDGRLNQHRIKHNAKYTILVTPDYVPSALEDIKGTQTCILTSHCFASLISKYIFKMYKNRKECSYSPIENIVISNMGKDISEDIYKLIDNTIGIGFSNEIK